MSCGTGQVEMNNHRIDGPTPSGGDYSEMIFLDDSHNVVEKEKATHGVIRECKENGTLIKETWFRCDLDRRQEK